MRQKELRIALVCYGGVSLAVYMHGVTKEVWHLARASRAHHAGEKLDGVAAAYQALLEDIEAEQALKLRILPDILTGASAGGINAVFLAQAVHSGCSLEPLTDLWLENADVSELTDPDAEPVWRFAKLWAQPIAEWFLSRPGNAVSESVSPETRNEVRNKVSRLVRGRWFSPPFSGARFSAMLFEALQSMAAGGRGPVLLPPGHPIDLLVTVTDFRGHPEMLRLNSPPVVRETEHRMPISFRALAGETFEGPLADPLELVLAARATASFPGAFPPLTLKEIDRLGRDNGHAWHTRGEFLSRVMPVHVQEGTAEDIALIDGAVLVNAPFGAALEAMRVRTSQREVDRRLVYIEPRPNRTRFGTAAQNAAASSPVSWFGAIFGALSTIPREQPIRDDLERIEQQSRDAARLRRIIMGLRPQIEHVVETLFGRTFFLDRPTPKRLASWRARAQQAAAQDAGYAFGAYAQAKFSSIVDRLAALTHAAAPGLALPDPGPIAAALRNELAARGLETLTDGAAGASEAAIAFFRAHDIGFRIRRLQLLARRLSRDWEVDPDIPDDALDLAREKIFDILSVYRRADDDAILGDAFAGLAARVFEDPGAVLDYLADTRLLPETDLEAEILLADALQAMPKNLKRRMLLTYLGFPFYDVATLPLLQSEGLDEYNPVKIDRISPDDARSIREGGTLATLRGVEFYNFGAFFSRAYRENDYLWGRLHGAERMVDLIASTVEQGLAEGAIRAAKRRVFLAILDEEAEAARCGAGLVAEIRYEVDKKL
ncbi:patatin-like protein [Erythrobacter sp.]|uniref:patatin-like protein n=1 Tax=Erythrobacter sp. TaxID=1042 RepID=UPI002EC81CC6|nr:patatin-like protein [Erythrobacter sp.]